MGVVLRVGAVGESAFMTHPLRKISTTRDLARTELKLEIEAIPDAVLVLRRNGSIVHANSRAARLLGYEPQELAPRMAESLLPTRYREEYRKLMQRSFEEPAARPIDTRSDFRAVTRDGEEFPLEIAIGPMAGGEQAVVVLRDTTAATQLSEELRDSEQRFRIAAAQTADVLQHINVEDNRYMWFGDIDGLLGYEPGEFPRTFDGWLEHIHPDDIDRIKAEVECIVENGEPGWNLHYRIRAKDGSYQHWLDRGTVTGFVDGRANEGIGAIVDQTHELKARQELEQALAEIRRLKARLEAEGEYLRQEIKGSHNFDEIVGSSPEVLTTLQKLERVADTNATVLLLGETGTGKELLARATHAKSKRSKRPLIKVDCTTLPSGLVESELFGHEKGAFTGAHESKIGRFELAHRGTIFLDEVGELPLELQSKLLRVIQDGELERLGGKGVKKVEVRVIAATNRNLRDEVRAGRFREDLYYRLNVFPVEIPPLRNRPDDIPTLAMFFLAQRGKALGKQVERIPAQTMEMLIAYAWPGNVRELQNVIERAIILSSGPELLLAEPLEPREARPQMASGVLRKDLEELERKQILDALETSHWRIKGDGNAADRLGLKPSTLRSRMKRLGIERV